MKAIVVGAGGTTRDLLRRLGDLWEISVVDLDVRRLDGAASVRPIEAIHGDGSSRVVLERAGIAEADAVVAATNDDDVNLEVCRLAREVGLLRIIAVVARNERLVEYRDAEIATISPHSLLARQLELSLEPRRVASTAPRKSPNTPSTRLAAAGIGIVRQRVASGSSDERRHEDGGP